MLKAYQGAWIAVQDKNDFENLCDLDALLDGFKLDKSDTEDRIDAGEVEKVGDADAVTIDGRDGKERTTVWVAVEAPHHVLKMAPTNDTGAARGALLRGLRRRGRRRDAAQGDIVKIPSSNR